MSIIKIAEMDTRRKNRKLENNYLNISRWGGRRGGGSECYIELSFHKVRIVALTGTQQMASIKLIVLIDVSLHEFEIHQK